MGAKSDRRRRVSGAVGSHPVVACVGGKGRWVPEVREDMNMSRFRIGIDVGGTFTDFTIQDTDTGGLLGLKVPTTPQAPVQGILDGLHALADEFDVQPEEIGYFVHGTTIAVNTLIERKGARLGMLVTRGFRDLLIIQRLLIPNTQNWFGGRPTPLIRRQRISEIEERLNADGSVRTPISEEGLVEALRRAREQEVTGLVVCFLHAFRNPAHEIAAREFLREHAPDLFVCCSHEVWPRMREYERAIITIINAYIMPRLDRYLGSLEDSLEDLGVTAVPYITRSNGGIMTARSARGVPADTLLSGPAAGVIGATQVARQAGIYDFITLDIGGTSADVAIINNGQPQTSQNEHVADFPIMMPVVGVSSIGAGGGSVAWLDDSGVLKMGPESVGSDPGPACYGRGNHRPALTDAFLVGGYLNPKTFAGGRLDLSPTLAEKAIASLSEVLEMTLGEAVDAVLAVTVAALYAELSNLAAERGVALRDYSLVAYGGAGSLLACRVAEETGIERVLVPPSPGTLCALGALSADVAGNFVESVIRPLDQALPILADIYDGLEAKARRWLEDEAPELDEHSLQLSADMRYLGQSFEIDVALEPEWVKNGDAAAIESRFHETHRKVFAHADPTAAVELIDLRILIAGTTPKPPAHPVTASRGTDDGATKSRDVFTAGALRPTPVYRRVDLAVGQSLRGPVLVDQDDTTVYAPAGWSGRVHESGSLILERQSH
ncbi:MAG: hydantoinase/oxoprolinase family protein [Alphaproteobacteria bacterium]|nr:hydantoinase/oxoprolinase family protein [Alphaproteobacteria bacterium]